MRVLWISTFPPRRCGIGDYSFDLVADLSHSGLRVRVLTYADGVPAEIGKGDIDTYRDLREGGSADGLAAHIEDFRPDLVHFQSSSFLHRSVVNRTVADHGHVPLVTTVHDTPRSWRVFYAIPSLRKVYQNSVRIFVHSTGVSQTLSNFHGVDPARIVKIPHGVDVGKYSPEAPGDEVRARFRLEGKRLILFFGFLRPGKGVDVLLEAWCQVEPSFPEAVLVIAGDAPGRSRRYGLLLGDEAGYPDRMRRLAANLGVRKVLFTGYVPESQVPGLLASAEVVVLPYDANTSQSGPLHKALGCGRPVVATDVPGFREVIEDGKDGILVPPRNAERLAGGIRTLLEDPGRAREVGRRARTKAEKSLSWTVVASRTLETYNSIVSELPTVTTS